jgi:hypothetical protein
MLLEIVYQAFTHDEFFEINFDALERLEKTLHDYRFHVSRALPVHRQNMEEAILDLKKPLESGRRFLLDYAEEAINGGKFKLKESGFTKYINDYPKYLENCLYWKNILIKHTEPDRLEEFTQIVTEDLTPEETAEFFKRAAEVDEKDSDEILESLEMERIATERVETRRAAPDYKKIEGPELSQRVKESIAWHKELAQKRERETPPEKISRDMPELFNRYLKIYHAVTGDRFPPERYEDEQSRKDEEMGKMLDHLDELSNDLYLIIKHQKPHLFEEFHRITTLDMTPEELEEFQKKIAHLEATRLDEILAGRQTETE